MDPIEAQLREELEAHAVILGKITKLRDELLAPLPNVRQSIDDGLA